MGPYSENPAKTDRPPDVSPNARMYESRAPHSGNPAPPPPMAARTKIAIIRTRPRGYTGRNEQRACTNNQTKQAGPQAPNKNTRKHENTNRRPNRHGRAMEAAEKWTIRTLHHASEVVTRPQLRITQVLGHIKRSKFGKPRCARILLVVLAVIADATRAKRMSRGADPASLPPCRVGGGPERALTLKRAALERARATGKPVALSARGEWSGQQATTHQRKTLDALMGQSIADSARKLYSGEFKKWE